MIEWLKRVIPAPSEAPDPLPLQQREAMQAITRATAFEPASWTPEQAARLTAMFDEMASSWNERQSAGAWRYQPLYDALARGEVGDGRCLEVGSGTGLATPALRETFTAVVGLDLSFEMVRRGSGPRVHADANVVPFRPGAFDSAVLVNAILFPRQIDQLLAPGGTVVWINTRGAETPIHLPPDDVAAALPGNWAGVAADAGLGQWCVLRRA